MNKFQRLEIEILDKRIDPFKKEACNAFMKDWIHAIRKALNIPITVLVKKLCVSQQTLYSYEKGEVNGTVSINTLKKVADAMGCNLVYAFVPREKSFRKKIEQQADRKAKQIIEASHHSMALENQSIQELESSIKELSSELLTKQPKDFWHE